MSDDKLLKTLAAAARKDAATDTVDPRWDQYSAGELSDAELDQLRAESVVRGEPEQTEEAFRPLSDDFRRDLASQARAQLSQSSADSQPSNTIVFPKPFKGFLAPLALAATILAMLGVSILMFQTEELSPLPAYVAALQGGSEFRSDPQTSDVPKFKPGDRLELRLTPATAVAGIVTSRVLVSDGRLLKTLDQVQIELAPSGSARITGYIGDSIPLSPGLHRLIVVIGRDQALPADKTLLTALNQNDPAIGRGWQAWAFAILVEAP